MRNTHLLLNESVQESREVGEGEGLLLPLAVEPVGGAPKQQGLESLSDRQDMSVMYTWSDPGCGVKTLGKFFHSTLLQFTQLFK